MAKADAKQSLAMLLRVTQEYDFWHLTGHPVQVQTKDSGEDSIEPHSLSYSDYDRSGDLADFKINCQSHRENAREGRSCYAWTYGFYSVYFMDLRRAKSAVKILTAIEAKIAKIEKDLGEARTYEAYLTRVSYSVGITSFLLENEPPAADRGRRWRLVNGTLATTWIREQQAAYLARYAPANAP